jgi:N-acetylneuraminate synthase
MSDTNAFIIAEVGINHNGDIKIAKKLIDIAHSSGCDAVKFQKRTINTVYSEDVLDCPRESPWGTTQRQQKEGLEFGKEEYDIIDEHCRELGIKWTSSAWDIESLYFINNYNVPFHKVASAMLTHAEFLNEVAKCRKHTYISTGLSTMEHVDAAVEIFKNNDCPFTLLHCVSTYPTKEEDSNLLTIKSLEEKYGCGVGYSGHESGGLPTLVAAALGAPVIERHITLDKEMYGSDQSASLNPKELKELVSTIRQVQKILGNGKKSLLDDEIPIANKLRYWE